MNHRHAFVRALLGLAVLAAGPAAADHDLSPHPETTAPNAVHCTDLDAGTHDFVTASEGGALAFGAFSAPPIPPTVLVVIGHGSTHTVESWRPHMEAMTDDYGTLNVAMEYRGMERVAGLHHNDGDPTLPQAIKWPQKAGGEDLIAAAKRFQAECPSIQKTILVGVSMGVAMSGYAVTHLDPLDVGLFDYWVACEGVHNMPETYVEATAIAHPAATWIEEDTGGTPAEVPEEYEERSNLLQADAISNSGLQRVVYLHALFDGTVGYPQSRQMPTAVQLPYEFYTVTTRGEGPNGTTLVDLLVDDGDAILAGHAGEWNAESLLMRATFERVGALANDPLPPCGEYLVEEGAVYPDVEFPPVVTGDCTLLPEPGAAAALFAGGVLLLGLRRRRGAAVR